LRSAGRVCWAGVSDVTRLLSAIDQGDPHAADELLPLVYDELRKLAAQRLAQEKPGQTLQATALVHEAYLRLVGGDRPHNWNGGRHYFAAAAEAMRRILVECARRKQRVRHGGDRDRVDLDELTVPAADDRAADLLAVDEALTAFAHEEPAKAELVKLRYFAGLTLEEAAGCLGISISTAKRHWALARAWLFAALTDGPGPPD
jgi:RNA polymerase sigma factor (TIGR02999 family)